MTEHEKYDKDAQNPEFKKALVNDKHGVASDAAVEDLEEHPITDDSTKPDDNYTKNENQ